MLYKKILFQGSKMTQMEALDLDELADLAPDELFNFIEGITDEQAMDSDIGGDSEADDDIQSANLLDKKTSVRKKRSFNETNSDFDDFDSDDSVADPDFQIEKRRPHITADYEFSDEDELPLSNFIQSNPPPSNDPDYPWSKNPYMPHSFEAFLFSETHGPKIPTDQSPINIFSIVLGDDFLELIVKESNRYALQKKVLICLTLEELKAFIGILILMGLNPLPSLRLYWSTDQNFTNHRISSIMTLKRFLKILRFLHLNDNESMPKKGDEKFDRLYKIRPMITYLQTSFFNAYQPGKDIAVDESMVAFKGRTHLKQYMPQKPIKRGFKIWALSCSITGYLLNFSVYEGKKESNEEGSLGEKTVLELTKRYENKFHCVFFDNFFTSFPLLTKLLDRSTFGCGTLRSNKKHFPSNHLVPDKTLESGESDSAGTSSITVDKWKDRGRKCVLIATTMHTTRERSTVERTNKEGEKVTINCPKSVSDYNKNMGGVDLFDQLHACYNISWKSRRWWLKLFYYLVDASIVNSFILYKTGASTSKPPFKPKSHLMFRSMLANQLIGDYNGRKAQSSWLVIGKNKAKKEDGRAVSVENTVRLSNVGEHLPTKTTSRRCARCSTEKTPKRSNVACTKCGVALCISCFAPFHNK